MNIISTIILVLFSLGAIGQQQEFNYDNTIVHIVNGNINHFRRIVNCPLLEIKQNEIPTTILSSVNKHILSRLGPTFFKKLKLTTCHRH